MQPDERALLLKVAQDSIAHGLQHGRPLPVNPADYPESLRALRASFVTLKIGGELRGCIGMLEASRPLVEDVADNAFAAAFRDPRFAPLSAAEYPDLEYHIAILSPPQALRFNTEAQLLAQLRPGIDGLILQDRGKRATFLPSVWESLPDPAGFLRHLKLKANLPADHWSDTLTAATYTVEDIC